MELNETKAIDFHSNQTADPNRFARSEEFLCRAEKSIPLGTQTFSKSRTQYPKGVSPFFASRAEGAYLWDVDGNRYVDFVNSLLSISLGYNDPDVKQAVLEQLELGTLFSLPHELEFLVAEQIIDMVPCAEKVRFGKNGSDATAGAVRLARAHTGRDHVLVCGYHGWQDWYIGSTTRDLGIPESTKSLTHAFSYNDIGSLQRRLEEFPNHVAAVILEPVNIAPPMNNFLSDVKDLAHRHGALLVFDETITGFRYANGGAQEFFGVTPDLATFGKGLANGYPLSALVGRSDVMQKLDEIFFSFTFGGETLSLAAANAVLNKMQREPVVEKLNQTGETIINRTIESIQQNQLQHVFDVCGYPCWSFFTINDQSPFTPNELKTLLLQEMFANEVLMIGTHNISYAHDREHVEQLVKAYECYFEKVNHAVHVGDIKSVLRCEPLEPLFKVR